MKKILFIASLFVSIAVTAQLKIPARQTANGPFFLSNGVELFGVMQTQPDTLSRNAIPSYLRYDGMYCSVTSNKKLYRLDSINGTPNHWTEFLSAGASEIDPVYTASSWYTTTNNHVNWDAAYSGRISSVTTTGSSGAASLSGNVLNIPQYTLAGLGGISLTGLSVSTASASGSGALSYNNSTGVFTFTPPSLSSYLTSVDTTNISNFFVKVRSLFTAGTNISIANGVITNGITNNNQLTNGAGYITGNQSITLSGDVTGSGTTAITTTLATVNSNTGSFGSASSVPTFTVNGKGLITAAGTTSIQIAESQVTNLTSDLGNKQAALSGTGFVKISGTSISYDNSTYLTTGSASSTYVPIAGGITMTGLFTLSGDPSTAYQPATKNYVDNLVTGLYWKASAHAATTANITLSGTQTIDGVAVGVGDRVLVKNQSTGSQNGIYVVASGAWSRSADANTGTELWGATIFIDNGGTVNGGTQWSNSNTTSPTLGTDAITFAQIAGAGVYTNGTYISLTGNVFDVGSTYSSNWNTAYNRSGTGLTFTSSTFTFTKQDGSTLTASVPTFNQNTTGSAATLTTPRAINGVNFDGSAAITITAAAGTLTGSSLNSTVTGSSLTSVGTIGTGVWQGTAIADSYISSASTWNGKQAAYTNLTSIGSLTNNAGWLYNNGTGTFSYTSPTKSTVGLGNVENTALSTWAGSGNITTVGTLGNLTVSGGDTYFTQTSISIGNGTHTISLQLPTLSSDPTITWPSSTGTIALTSQIPTSLPASDVYAWAKASTKPSYTATEIGLGNVTNNAQWYSGSHPTTVSGYGITDIATSIGLSGYVPYTGATTNINLNGKQLTNSTQIIAYNVPGSIPSSVSSLLNANTAIVGYSTSATGIWAYSRGNTGLVGQSDSSTGVYGYSTYGPGLDVNSISGTTLARFYSNSVLKSSIDNNGNFSGTAANATTWNGQSFATGLSGSIVYALASDGTNWRNFSNTSFQSWLGLGSAAYLAAYNYDVASSIVQRTSTGQVVVHGLDDKAALLDHQALVGVNASNSTYQYYTAANIQSFLGLGSNAYTSNSITTAFYNTNVDVSSQTGDYITMTTGAGVTSSNWAHVLNMAWNPDQTNWVSQIAIDVQNGTGMFWRSVGGGVNTNINSVGWKKVLDANNYSSYAVPTGGGTMTGALAINGTGNLLQLGSANSGNKYMDINMSGASALHGYKIGGGWAMYATTDLGYTSLFIGQSGTSITLNSSLTGTSATFTGNVVAYSCNSYNNSTNGVSVMSMSNNSVYWTSGVDADLNFKIKNASYSLTPFTITYNTGAVSFSSSVTSNGYQAKSGTTAYSADYQFNPNGVNKGRFIYYAGTYIGGTDNITLEDGSGNPNVRFFNGGGGQFVGAYTFSSSVTATNGLISTSANSGMGSISAIAIDYNAGDGRLFVNKTTGQSTFDILLGNNGTFTDVLYFNSSLNAVFSGSVTASSGFFNSDIRLKNISERYPTSEGFDFVVGSWKSDSTNHKHYWNVAQEVEQVYPWLVNTDDKGMKSINYTELHTKEIYDLQQEVKNLKSALDEINNKLNQKKR